MSQKQVFKLRLVLTPDQAGGFVVTSPDLPELVTEGDTAAEAIGNVSDALEAVRELYEDMNKPFPPMLRAQPADTPVAFETLIEAA
jgi:antitoxin HicB